MIIHTEVYEPLYAQLAIFDPLVPDSYPLWESGNEEAVASRHGVAFQTIPDHLGNVVVQVAFDNKFPDDHRVLFDGQILVTGGKLAVGSLTGSHIDEVDVGSSGIFRIRITSPNPIGDVRNALITIDKT